MQATIDKSSPSVAAGSADALLRPAPARPELEPVARRYFTQNAEAFAARFPWLPAISFPPPAFPNAEVVAARDGSLHLRDESGWLGGCSVPRAAAAAMLAAVKSTGSVAFLLEPPHAEVVLQSLTHLNTEQSSARVVIALVCEELLPAIAAQANLVPHIASHRLFLITASSQLRDVYRRHPGLASPGFFIRLSFTDEARVTKLVPEAQAAIARVLDDQRALGTSLRDAISKDAAQSTARHPLCLVGAMAFRLWNDAPSLLAAASFDPDIAVLDTDDPTTATSLAILHAAARARAICSADLWRHQLSDLLPLAYPWHHWLAADQREIPPFSLAGPQDLLMLSSGSSFRAAIGAGWPACRVRLVVPPSLVDDHTPSAAKPLLLAADCLPLVTPPEIEEYSSLRLLWEAIREELLGDPSRLGPSAVDFLSARRSRLGLRPDQLDSNRFLRQLIEPAFAQGIALALLRRSQQLVIHGCGWLTLAEHLSAYCPTLSSSPANASTAPLADLIRAAYRGPINSREDLARAARDTRALVDFRPPASNQVEPLPLLTVSGLPLLRFADLLSGQLAGRIPQPSVATSTGLPAPVTIQAALRQLIPQSD